MRLDRGAMVALAGAGAVLASGGTALAQSGDGSRAARCEDRLERMAERQGISVAELEANLKARLAARIEAALNARRIRPERAAALQARLAAAELCKPARVFRVHVAKHRLFRAAAAYLGLDARELRAALPGTSLAALAEAKGKSVTGLEEAMLAPARARLERAVESERITRARAERALDRLEARVERLVQKVFPAR